MMPGVVRSAVILALTAALSFVAALGGLVSGGEKFPSAVMRRWGRAVIRLGGWSVRAEGLEYLPPGGAILVANHQSFLDIPLIVAALDREVKFLAKVELGRIPLFGRAMAAAGNMFVDREDPRNAIHLVREAAGRMRAGELIVIFPEGTRSGDGEVGEFRPGAFFIAQKSGLPLLPLLVDGGARALPKGSLRPRPASLVARVLPPIPCGRTVSREEMAAEARRRIVAARAGGEAGPESAVPRRESR